MVKLSKFFPSSLTHPPAMANKPTKLKPQHQKSSHHYTPIPCQHDESCSALPPSHQHHHLLSTIRLPSKRVVVFVGIMFFFISVGYVCWPSDPTLKIVRLRINKMHIHPLPIITIDVSLDVTVLVRNLDVYSLEFTDLDVSLRYRGKRLGHVKAGEGHVRALASSYVDAELEFSGVHVLSDVVFLLEDLAKGRVPFDTVTEVEGKFGFLLFAIPLKARMSCEILINTTNQTIVRQSCATQVL